MDGLPNALVCDGADGCPNVVDCVGANGCPKGFVAAAAGCWRKSGPEGFPKALGCCCGGGGVPKGPGTEAWPNVGVGIEGLPKVEDGCPKPAVEWPSVEAWPKAEDWLG